MRILITGVAGFIGSHLSERYLESGAEVVGLDSFDDFYARPFKEANLERSRSFDSFSLVEGDIRDGERLAALPDVEAIVHLAALAGVRPSIEAPERYVDVNVRGTMALLEHARTRDVRPLVFASSSSVYGNNEKVPFSEDDPVEDPISPYAATKRAGELLCSMASELWDLRITSVRFFTVIGPRQRPDLAIHKFARHIAEGRPIPMFGDGTSSRDYTYIDDIVTGVVAALDHAERHAGSRIFNLGNSHPVTLKEMIDTVAEEMGVTPEIERLPDQPGDVRRTYADIAHAREALGYEPATSFREGVRSFVRWFEEGRAAGRS